MYTVIVGSDSSIVASVVEPIIQGSNFEHTMRILVPPEYHGYDTTTFMSLFEYKTPSGAVGSETLTASEQTYKGFVEYLLPVKSAMTNDAGVVVFCITFLLNVEENGRKQAVVLKTQPADLMIWKSDEWIGDLPDGTLNAIDEKMLKLAEMQEELKGMQDTLNNSKADNLAYDGDRLQLTANGEPIGDAVEITDTDESIEWIEV